MRRQILSGSPVSPKMSPFARYEHKRICMKPNDWIDGKALISKHLHGEMLAGALQRWKGSIESPPLRLIETSRVPGPGTRFFNGPDPLSSS